MWDVIYAPFGGTAWISDATAKLDMRFPGQWFQMENGLAYNWHRHYDATLGRYVQPDPLGYDGGPSLYGYVELLGRGAGGGFGGGGGLGGLRWPYYRNPMQIF